MSRNGLTWDADKVTRDLRGLNYTEWEGPSEELMAKQRKRRQQDFRDEPSTTGKEEVDVRRLCFIRS